MCIELCPDLPDIPNVTITYTPPRDVSPELPDDQRYTGTIATYSCSSGYQLVGGSSPRACGPDGTWNGAELSNIILCQSKFCYFHSSDSSWHI